MVENAITKHMARSLNVWSYQIGPIMDCWGWCCNPHWDVKDFQYQYINRYFKAKRKQQTVSFENLRTIKYLVYLLKLEKSSMKWIDLAARSQGSTNAYQATV